MNIRLAPLLARSKAIAWFLLLLNIALFFFRPLSFPDVWWQLDDGHQVVHHAAPGPRLTFGEPAAKLTDEYAAYEAGLYLAASMGGAGLLVVGYWALATAPFAAAFFNIFRRSRQDGVIAFALTVICWVLAGYIQQRPAVLGNLFLYLLVAGLLRHEDFFRKPSGWLALGVLFCFWTNTHSSYVIGLGTLGLFLMQKIFREGKSAARPALGCMGVAVLATALHPSGIGRWVFTLQQYGDRWGYVISSEMGAPSLPFQALTLAGFALGLFLYFQSRQRAWWWLVTAAVVTAMSLSSYRFSNHLAALLLAALTFPRRDPLASWPPARAIALVGVNCLASTFLIVAAMAELFLILPITHRKQPWINPMTSSTELLDQLGASSRPQAVLTDAVVGSYAYDRGNLRTLNDTGMARYAPETKRYYYYLYKNPVAFRLALDRLHVDEVVVGHHDYLWAAVLNGRNDWRLTRITTHGLLYQRRPATPLSPTEQDELRGFIARSDVTARAVFAVRLLPDAETLGFLQVKDGYFDEGIYTALREALALMPADAVKQFYHGSRPGQFRTAIRLLILERLGLFQEAKVLAAWWTLHDIGWEDEVPRAEAFLEAGDAGKARCALEIVYPRPVVSPLYQALRAQLFGLPSSKEKSELLWNTESQAWFKQTTERWNAQLDRLTGGENRSLK